MHIAIKTSLKDITPYQQGQGEIEGVAEPIKLSSNELPYPPSPAAVAAFHATEVDLARYPDGNQTALRQAIAKLHSIPQANIFAGNGSEEAIGLVIRSMLTQGNNMIVSQNSFMMAEIYARSIGVDVIKCAETDHRVDIDNMLAAVNEHTRMVYICSPNNPTGTYTNIDELKRLEASLDEHIILLVDAAYAEFVTQSDYDSGLKSLFKPDGRVVVTRTFSKAYGLAALRIGWAAAPNPVIEAVSRLRTPFNTNSAALNAATAALLDQDYLNQTVTKVNTTRNQFSDQLQALGLTLVPSEANFVLITFAAGGQQAQSLNQALQQAGILGRPVSGDSNEFRISIGTEEEMTYTIQVIKLWVEQTFSENN